MAGEKDARPRVIVTTDLEVDDMNSLVHLALYLNELDVAAFVYTASQYHFQGDGTHTLAQVNPHWRTKGRRSYEWERVPREPDPEAGSLTSYRPFPEGWIERLWTGPYASAWPHLRENGGVYPSPEELVARTYVGNVAFEGDVREETPGSRAIEDAILDDDPRTLWLLSWGGMNTIVRALMSVAEKYQGTPEWDAVRERVCTKVRVLGVTDGIGQDNSWLDHGRALFPELTLWRVPFAYGGYVDAKFAQEDSIGLFRAPWPQEHLIDGNGPLMAEYKLYGDGRHYEGEPARFQFGEHATLDWGLPGMEPLAFSPGDFFGRGRLHDLHPAAGHGPARCGRPQLRDTPGSDVPGRRSAQRGRGQPLRAPRGKPQPVPARYSGGVCDAGAVVRARPRRLQPRAGDRERDAGPCGRRGRAGRRPRHGDRPRRGRSLSARWCCDPYVSRYAGKRDLASWKASGLSALFSVPEDARPGDRFVLRLTVRDDAESPLTRYAEVAVAVR